METGAPRIAVVVPVFNRRRMIVECLGSIAAQVHAAARVVVVDDASTDGSAESVRGWIAQRPDPGRWRLVTLPRNAGAAAARNRGVEAAGACEFVAFLDSDDLWPPDFLSRAAAAMDREPRCVAGTADLRIERPGRPAAARGMAAIESDLPAILFRDAGIGSATVLRRDAVERAGGYPESVATGHDLHLYCAVSAFGGWRHIPGAPVTKRRGLHAPDEAGHLAGGYADRMQRWAQVYQAAIEEHGERLGLGLRARARLIGARWYRAGKAARDRGDMHAARSCLRQAIRWRPLDVRPRVHLLGTYVS